MGGRGNAVLASLVGAKLDEAYDDLTERAWKSARDELENLQARLQTLTPKSARLTPNVIAAAGAEAIGAAEPPAVRLSKAEAAALEELVWTDYADPELLRRRVNLDKKRRDYPEARRSLPTRLGNILRAHEDDTGQDDVETFIQRVFDDLPPSLKAEHDEQRTRLDLYCSMVFVVAFVKRQRRRGSLSSDGQLGSPS